MSTVEITRPRAGVALVTLNRPSALNAMNAALIADLHAALASIRDDRTCRVVVLTGAGRAFCAGGDVTSMASYDVVSGRRRSKGHNRMVLALHNLEKPVIAAIRGPAAGIGASLALACDLIIAAENAYLLMAFKNIGIPPDGGAVYFLTQHLGIARAKELVYSARRLPAQEARDMGIVMKVVPDGELEAEVHAFAAELATSATYALGLAKRMFHSMYTPSLEQLLELENLAIAGARLTHDHQEGIAAFREKRKPKFSGS